MNRRCPHCRAPLAKTAREAGAVLLVGKTVLLFADKIVVTCACGHQVTIPITLNEHRQPLLLTKKKAV